ncbi:unnamed protein product [Bursaphelenchus xylophilus]|uniref:(pine wood nematode) hypothetical protein n=1 Tax=Bursaphelenchus xylophilus TaxID=6326 RepID=A0A1I7SS75_BURXY|nr:unnamed protein product [Bursaphelenchus xylophilus]CAG9097975.1 unnamed protein product [Bursaphelenchus xylophilus]
MAMDKLKDGNVGSFNDIIKEFLALTFAKLNLADSDDDMIKIHSYEVFHRGLNASMSNANPSLAKFFERLHDKLLNVEAVTNSLLDIPSTTCHLAKKSRLGHHLDCDGPLKASKGAQKSPIHLKEESGVFGVFPEELAPGQSFGIFLKNNDDLFKHVSYTATLTASDGEKNESIHIKVVFDDQPLEMLEFDSLEYVIHVSNPITEGILKKFKVVNSEATQPTMFQYNLEGTFSEFFSIEPADPDLILLRAKGCSSLCPSLPAHFPLILTISDGNRLPTNVLLNIVMLWDTTTVFDTLKVGVKERSKHFDRLVRAHFDDQDMFNYNFTNNSEVFEIDKKYGILSIKNHSRLTIDNLGRDFNISILLTKDSKKRGEQNLQISLIPENPAQLQKDEYSFKVVPNTHFIHKFAPKYDGYKLNYSMMGDISGFKLDQNTGEFEYIGDLFKFERVYNVQIISSYEDYIYISKVSIIVIGLGSEPPKFKEKISNLLLDSENLKQNEIFTFEAIDEDSDSNLFYNLTSVNCYNNPGCKEMISLTEDGRLTLKKVEGMHLNLVQLEVEVRDLQYPMEPSDKTILFIAFLNKTPKAVIDGTKASHLTESTKYFYIPDISNQKVLGKVEISEAEDVTIFSEKNIFTVSKEGEIYWNNDKFEYSNETSIPAIVTATDGNNVRQIPIVVRSSQNDVNLRSNAPAQVRIYEDIDVGSYIGQLDLKSTPDEVTLSYSPPSAVLSNALRINQQGVIKTSDVLNGLSGVYSMIGIARFGNQTERFSILLEILSVSNCNPSFSDKNPIILYEGEKTIVLVDSTDQCNLTFSVDDPSISIGEKTGELSIEEVKQDKIITITAEDGGHKIQYEIEVRKGEKSRKRMKCMENDVTLQLKGNIEPNIILGRVNVEGKNKDTRYRILKSYGVFEIDEKGELSVKNYTGQKEEYHLKVDVFDDKENGNRVQCQITVKFVASIKQSLAFSRPKYEVVLNDFKLGTKVIQLNVKDEIHNKDVFYGIKKTYYQNKETIDDIFEVNPLSGDIRLVKNLYNITQSYFQLNVMAQKQDEIIETSVVVWLATIDDIENIVIKVPPTQINEQKMSKVIKELSEMTESKAILAGINYYVVNGVPLNNGTILRILFVRGNKIVDPITLRPLIELQYTIHRDNMETDFKFERALLISNRPLEFMAIGFVSVLLVGFSIIACFRCHYQHKFKVELKRFRKLSEAVNRVDTLENPNNLGRSRANTLSTATDIMEKTSVKSDKSEVQQVSMQL